MKYLLIKDIVRSENILSSVFLNCLSKENLDKIALENHNLTEKEREAREIEIELKINGISVDPKKFFDLFADQHADMVKRRAKEMVEEQVAEKFSEITDKLEEYRKLINTWAKNINWPDDSLSLNEEEK